MQNDTTSPIEIVAEATAAGARRFLARVKERTLKTTAGRTITTKELAEALVTRADLEHAIVEGTRPKEILCSVCKVPVKVARKGPVPDHCAAHPPPKKKHVYKRRPTTIPREVRSAYMQKAMAAKTKEQKSASAKLAAEKAWITRRRK
jgi:hypothetical protein